MIKRNITLAALLIFALGSQIGTAVELKALKASANLFQKASSGDNELVLVVFDDSKVLQSLAAETRKVGRAFTEFELIEARAEQYKALKERVLSEIGRDQFTLERDYSHLPISALRFSSLSALAAFGKHEEIIGVYEDEQRFSLLAESLPLVKQPIVAAQGFLGAGTSVAVLDTGLDYTRSAFGSCSAPASSASCKVVVWRDFVASDGKLDSGEHGTNVAGIVVGVAPATKIVALKVLGANGGSDSGILAAINYAIANKSTYNIVALNMSLGSRGSKFTAPTSNSPYAAAFANAIAAGIIPVVASGNDGFKNGISSPAAVVGAVSVGAVYDSNAGGFSWRESGCTDASTAADQVTCFSNSASFLSLLAPGALITAAGITQGGTSQATPHVAGAVALLRAAFPNETLDATVARLTNGDLVTDRANEITKPRLNLAKALGVTGSCAYTASQTALSIPASGGSGTISVTTSSGCAWQADAKNPWIQLTSGSSGTGNGSFSYSVQPNASTTLRNGSITVAGQAISIAQQGATSGSADILKNGNFEDGALNWVQNAANGLPILTTYETPTANNRWYAWFCGYDNCVDSLSQDVFIPSDVQSADLQFSYYITSDEAAGNAGNDIFTARIYSPATATTFATCSRFTNADALSSWRLSAKCNLLAYRGQTIRIQFVGTTNSTQTTSFFVDDVSLVASASAFVDNQAPTTPTGLFGSVVSSTELILGWNASSDNVGVVGYKVYSSGTLLGTVTTAGARVSSLTPSTAYSFTVAACDAANNCSSQSAPVSISTPALVDTQPPTVPSGLVATPTSVSAIGLTWNAATDNVGVTNYLVYRSGTLIATLGNVRAFADIGLKAATAYAYSVAACDAANNCSAPSSPVQATTFSPFTAATPVAFVGASNYQYSGNNVNIFITKIVNNSSTRTSGSLRLEFWAFNKAYSYTSGSTGYKTAVIRTSQVAGLTDFLGANASFTNINLNLFYTPPALSGYSSYALILLEYNPSTCTASDFFCVIDYVNYVENSPPSVPRSLTASALGATSIGLSWLPSTDNVGVTNYLVYRNGTIVAFLGNSTSYSDLALQPATTYSYTVAACDAAVNCSAQSTAASATTLSQTGAAAPATPTGLGAVAISSTQINLSWNSPPDPTVVATYRVYSGGSFVGTVPGTATGSVRRNNPSTSYTYTIAACNGADICSAQSAPAFATTPAETPQGTLARRGGIDLDGSNRGAIVLRSGNTQLLAGRLVNSQFQFTPLADPGPSYRLVGVGDFDGNGRSDLAFQNVTQGQFGDVKIWKDFSSANEIFWRQVKQVWDVQAMGDLDGDGFGDLVWRYVADDPRDTGVSYIWFTNGSTVTQVRKRGGAPLNWKLLGAADLNKDGAADMIYISPDGQVRALMATANRTCANFAVTSLPPNNVALKLADFTGNGRGDMLLLNSVTGNVSLFALNATALTLPPPTANPDDPNASCTATSTFIPLTVYGLPIVDTTWRFYASGDFNGDGITDIVWLKPNGTLTLWQMNANGTLPTVIDNVGTAPSGYSVIQP